MAKQPGKGSGKPAAPFAIDLTYTAEQADALLQTLQERFESNMQRHPNIAWAKVRARLDDRPQKLASLIGMERSGGEPDVTGRDQASGAFIFCDCATQSPTGRRSLCYDAAALASRKRNKPAGSAQEMAAALGVELLTEAQYRALQTVGEFDTTTSSWVQTPADIRALGGALFCDRRYDHVFLYHNGAESYYGARGFRGRLLV